MVTFNFSYASGTSLDEIIGFELAGRIWSTYLTDDVTVNIHIQGKDTLPPNVIGGALPRINAKQDYGNVYKAMSEDIRSWDDWVAVSSRSDTKEYEARFDLYDNSTVNTGHSQKVKDMNITSANSKALKVQLAKGDANGLDGYIVMSQLSNSSVRWGHNYLRTGVATNTLDFLSTAMHEIGHVLGFVSGLDRPGWLDARVSNNSRKDYLDSLKTRVKYTTPLDLFRYSAESGSLIDLALGGDPFFSIDGGRTAIARFSTGKDVSMGGDGYQASHWKAQGSLGIMKPTLSVGERSNISRIDLQAFDIIGWDVSPTAVNTPLNLAVLLNQAKAGLAQRLGMTVANMEANPTLAAQRLGQDRTADVLAMIANSEVYEGRRNGNGNGSGNGRGGSWQEILDVFAQEGSFLLFGDEVLPAALRLRGTAEQDILRGGANHDLLIGKAGDDLLMGKAGSDQLKGNRGQDVLRGGSGEDKLYGNGGDDLLEGGSNRNILVGGKGADRFLLEQQGLQIVRDFTIGEDQLQLAAGLQFEQLTIEQQGRHTLISLNNNPLMQLQNTPASAIAAEVVL